MREASFRALPSVDRLLRHPLVRDLLTQYAREPVVRSLRGLFEEARDAVAAGYPAPSMEALVDGLVKRVRSEWVQSPQTVVNATGVILHTNLGRAPLSSAALQAITEAAGYSDLEYGLSSGERTARGRQSRVLLTALTGAESAHVVTNGAAAVTLALAVLARGKEVIISRGEAVEIGGGFRVPSVLRQSGARLVEVGTTNRTRLEDYAEAISTRTGAILHVHSSNFRIVGFTENVALSQLAALAHEHGIPLIDDNGSGALLDTGRFGLAHEPTPQESLQAGADVVAFSGDKLLGGPQAGILLGREGILRRIAPHPLARAMRSDKLTIAALNATLLAYLRGDAQDTLPLWHMIRQSAPDLAHRSGEWQRRVSTWGLKTVLEEGFSTVGGGSLPGETLPTTLLVLPAHVKAADLRACPVPIIGITREGRVRLDPRTVLESQEDSLLQGLRAVSPDPGTSELASVSVP